MTPEEARAAQAHSQRVAEWGQADIAFEDWWKAQKVSSTTRYGLREFARRAWFASRGLPIRLEDVENP